jgi:hypothetical protein
MRIFSAGFPSAFASAARASAPYRTMEGTGFELPYASAMNLVFAIAVAAREELKVCRLPAGGKWIRTFSSALGRQRFRAFVRVGTDLPAHRSSEQLPDSTHRYVPQLQKPLELRPG